jgi:hypothetical protein
VHTAKSETLDVWVQLSSTLGYDSGMNARQHQRKMFWSAFFCGMSSPTLLFSSDAIRLPRVEVRQGSDLDAMRGDWEKIGNDFRTVIAREEAATTSQ